jgi:hypothetical protein
VFRYKKQREALVLVTIVMAEAQKKKNPNVKDFLSRTAAVGKPDYNDVSLSDFSIP